MLRSPGSAIATLGIYGGGLFNPSVFLGSLFFWRWRVVEKMEGLSFVA